MVFRGLSDVGLMWSQWDTFVIDGVSICCRSIHLDAVSKHMSRHMRKLCWKSWAREHNVDEQNDNSCFQPVESIIKNTCTTIWTQEACGHGDVVGCPNGAVTQIRICASDGLRMTSARSVILFELRCTVYLNVGIEGASAKDLTDEFRMFEQIAENERECEDAFGTLRLLLPVDLNDVWRCEQQGGAALFCFYDPEVMPYRYERMIAVRGSLRRVAVNMFVAVGRSFSWISMVVIFRRIECMASFWSFLTNRRTIGKAEMLAFCMALVRQSGLACIYIDNFGVVQALRSQSSA